MSRSTNQPGWAEPEVYFKIVHATLDDTSEIPAYRDQTVEIALGPKGAFENGNVGKLARKVPTSHMVNAVPPAWGKPRKPKEAKTPRVIALLKQAIEWQEMLGTGQISQAQIADQESISRARVTQIMALLSLAPEIQKKILSMPNIVGMPAVTERSLRPITTIDDHGRQMEEFEELVNS